MANKDSKAAVLYAMTGKMTDFKETVSRMIASKVAEQMDGKRKEIATRASC